MYIKMIECLKLVVDHICSIKWNKNPYKSIIVRKVPYISEEVSVMTRLDCYACTAINEIVVEILLE